MPNNHRRLLGLGALAFGAGASLLLLLSPQVVTAKAKSARQAQTQSRHEKPVQAIAAHDELWVALPIDLPLGKAGLAHVVHARPTEERAIVYLHGVCGDITKIRDWSAEISQHATVLGVRGNVECGRERQRWSKNVSLIHERIQTALSELKTHRNGHLETSRVVLFGYSQGASRAQKLAALFPDAYPWVILGGPPTQPNAWLLRKVLATAIFGGSREPTSHMKAGYLALAKQNHRARFDILPDMSHGQFGPDAARLLTSSLKWLWRSPSGHE